MVVRKAASSRRPKLLTQVKGLLRQFDLKARKGLGQHFLIDEPVLKLIGSAAELTPVMLLWK